VCYVPSYEWTEQLLGDIIVSFRVLKCQRELVRLGQFVLLHQPVLFSRHLNVVVASAVRVHGDTVCLQLFHPLQSLLWAAIRNECSYQSRCRLDSVVWIHDGIFRPREVRQREITTGRHTISIQVNASVDLPLIASGASQFDRP